MRILNKKQTLKPRMTVGDVISSPYESLMVIKINKTTTVEAGRTKDIVETQYAILDLDDMTTYARTFKELDELNEYLWDTVLSNYNPDRAIIRNNKLVITSEDVLED